MGNCSGKDDPNATHIAYVKTGDKKGADTDGSIFITCTDVNDASSEEIKTGTKWKNDFEKGAIDVFCLNLAGLDKISKLCIRRDNTDADDSWYVEKIVVEHKTSKYQSIFPLHRWIHANSNFSVCEFDSCLPQEDRHVEQRKQELEKKQELYKLKAKLPGLPCQIEVLPQDESFSNDYQWDITSMKLKLLAQTKFIDFTTKSFSKLSDFDAVYKGKLLTIPYGYENWKTDGEFGNQRLSGCNPVMLTLCEKIPEHFAVTPEMVEPFLEDQKFDDVIKSKKLYLIDLTYLADIECTDNRELCGPTALFYSQKSGDLVPIAIQLMPKPGEDNPVFLPSDPEYTWLAAKMWFNLGDACHHQSVTHLGFTHLVMESVAVVTHRQLSPTHPLFRLLAPHFLYLLAINTNALNKLVSEGGWVDKTMTIGRIGMFNIIKRNWEKWNIHEHGNIVEDLKRRGVDDTEALPNYHYRDDALLLWNAIHKYVTTVVNQVYDTPEKLSGDAEVQAWTQELADSEKGASITGIPSVFSSNEELIEVLTVFVFTGSVGHAAANFCQYDEYAFPPNYPAFLHGERPKDKTPLSEDTIVQSLPTKEHTLSIMLVTKILSQRGTNELGNFEVQYSYHPIHIKAIEQLKTDLEEIGKIIDKRNSKRLRKYPYLHPKEVPNAISI